MKNLDLMKLFRVFVFLLVSFSSPALAQLPGSEAWRFATGGAIYSSVSIADDGTIYVNNGGDTPKLYAINPGGESTKWEFSGAEDWLDASPAIGNDGTVYVGSWDNKLYAINGDTGGERWSYETGSNIIASPAIATDGTIYFGSADFTFYALHSDGTLKWFFNVSDEIYSSPAIGPDGTVYFGCADESLYALNSDGSLQWRFPVDQVSDGEGGFLNGRIRSSPGIDRAGNIYFGSGNQKFYSLDREGNLRWSYDTADKVDSSPAIGPDNRVYFASRDGYLYALDTDGNFVWREIVGDVFYSSPVVDFLGNVYIVSYTGNGNSDVFGFDSNGFDLFSYTINHLVDASPVISDDELLYIGSFDGNLYAINTDFGSSDSDWPKFGHNLKNNRRLLFESAPAIYEVASGVKILTEGLNASFTHQVFSEDPTLTYQWRKDEVDLDGEEALALNLSNGVGSDVGNYDLVVSNSFGNTISQSVQVVVQSDVEEDEGEVFILYKHPTSTNGVQYGVSQSNDLKAGVWSRTSVTEEEIASDATGRTVKASVPSTPDLSTFLRLEVTEP